MAHQHDWRTAIVLQGGGALGAYEYGVVKALYESRPDFTPAVVTGISIGAINTAVLVGAKDDPIKSLDYVWREKFEMLQSLPPMVKSVAEQFLPQGVQQSLAAFGNPGMYQINPAYLCAPLQVTSVYNLHPLKETLEEVVDLKRLNQPDKTRVVVSAVNVQNTALTSFDNTQGLVLDHILASGSIAPSFPMTQIDGQFYWDGGFVSNTPLAQAINCLEELEPDNPDVRREIIVVELFSRRASLPTNMIEVLSRVAQLPFTSRLDFDRKLFAKFNRYIDLIHEIDHALPPDQDDIRHQPGYAELMGHKKIDALTVITSELPLKSSNAGDFSPATLSLRIETGHQDAMNQEIGKPQLV